MARVYSIRLERPPLGAQGARTTEIFSPIVAYEQRQRDPTEAHGYSIIKVFRQSRQAATFPMSPPFDSSSVSI